MRLVSIEDVQRASHAIAGVAVRTPLLACPWAEGPSRAEHQGRLLLKPENLQATGSFKIRGAYNAVGALSPDQRRTGVVAYSSGNHGQAVAYAARAFGVPCVVVMNDDAPAVKVAAVRTLGADIVPVPLAERVARAEELVRDKGYALVPPFAHADVVAGQGTVGLEIMEDAPATDVVLVPVGGGGLASGVATAVKAIRPSTAVIGVEPELAADAAESLRTGVLTAWPAAMTSRTIADGLRPTGLSELTFAHLRERLDGIVTVTEEHIRSTVGVLARSARLVAEPSGAVALAAYLYRRDQLPDGHTVAVVSGGNVDPRLLAGIVSASP
jgi:threonine dehydratase